ncbi:MAG: hypothetical protein ACOY16_07955 [Chloroflexota bacterium]
MRTNIGVTFLFLGVLSTTGLHLTRVVNTIQHWAYYQNLFGDMTYYLAISGSILFLIGAIGTILLWTRSNFVKATILGYGALFTAGYWIERLFIQPGVTQGNIWFVIGFQVIMWIIFLVIITRSLNTYLGEKHDR